jgi:hypothetical protein
MAASKMLAHTPRRESVTGRNDSGFSPAHKDRQLRENG